MSLLTAKQSAEYLEISIYEFKEEVKKGTIRFKPVGKRRKYRPEDLDLWQRNTQTHIDYISKEKSTMPTSRSHAKMVNNSTIEELLALAIEQRQKDGLLKKLTTSTKSNRQIATCQS
jgi:hypothetical protein